MFNYWWWICQFISEMVILDVIHIGFNRFLICWEWWNHSILWNYDWKILCDKMISTIVYKIGPFLLFKKTNCRRDLDIFQYVSRFLKRITLTSIRHCVLYYIVFKLIYDIIYCMYLYHVLGGSYLKIINWSGKST